MQEDSTKGETGEMPLTTHGCHTVPRALPAMPVMSGSGVGNIIQLQNLQNRCGLNDIHHKCATPPP